MEQKMRLLLCGLAFFCFPFNLFAQNWSYIGGSCCVGGNASTTQSTGSAELGFKSDGTPVVAAFNPLTVKEYNGTSWVALPSLGNVGGFDMEIYNDEIYLAIASTSGGLTVTKYDGTNWQNVGSSISGIFSTNYDFAIDNNGTPYVAYASTPAKLYKYDGTSWITDYTFPTGTLPNVNSYTFTGDNTMLFDANNNLNYMVTYLMSGKHFMLKYDGTSASLVADTIYGATATILPWRLVKNATQEIFAASGSVVSANGFVKKLNGTTWSDYGDTANVKIIGASLLLSFAGNDTLYVASAGDDGTKMVYCANGTSSFAALDTIDHTGFRQVTDMEVNPVTRKVNVAFNCINGTYPDYSVMEHGSGTTGIREFNFLDPSIYPNPANETFAITNLPVGTSLKITDMTGKLIYHSVVTKEHTTIDAINFVSGVYVIQMENKGSVSNKKLVVNK